MSYAKTFMSDYLYNPQEIYQPIAIKYIIYNLETNKFRSSNISTLYEFEYSVEILITEDNFTIFMSHPIEKEYFFIELAVSNDEIEEKIYDYYEFYDLKKSEIDISQEYSVFIDCDLNIFNITTTKFSSNKNIDTFHIVHFSKEKYT